MTKTGRRCANFHSKSLKACRRLVCSSGLSRSSLQKLRFRPSLCRSSTYSFYSAVVGSMMVFTCETLFAGNLPRRACSPTGADAYMMKHIIHDWDDASSIKILQNIQRAMDENGKVLIVEMVVPEGNEPSPAKALDLLMLVIEGGKERTEKEYRELLAAAGLRLTRVIPTRSPYSIVEAVKS